MTYNVQLHTASNPLEAMKGETPLKGFTPTFPDLLGEVPSVDDLKKDGKWQIAPQKGEEPKQQDVGDKGRELGIHLRPAPASGAVDLQNVIEERCVHI